MRATGWLVTFAIVVMVGSLLPWVDTVAGSFPGYQGAGLWTLAGGALIIAGPLVHGLWPHRWLLVGHAVVGGTVAVVLAGWQGVRLARLCGGGACAPGVGLGLVLIGGVGALLVARRVVAEGRAPAT